MKEPSAKDFIHLGGAAMQHKETCLKISIMSYLFTKPTSISFTVVGSLNCLCISSSALKYYFSVRFEKFHFVAGLQDYCLSFATLISLVVCVNSEKRR